MLDGLLVVDKPAGPTSHEVVARVRRALGAERAGHTGTLDPAATGVLPLVLGRATRLARFLSAGDKSYDAVVRLGVATDTQDAQGTPAGEVYGGRLPQAETIDRALDEFRGTFLQQPPAYSAKKIDGRRSYKIARARSREGGAAAAVLAAAPALPAPVPVTAHAIDLVGVDGDRVTLRVRGSAGFYVRALAHDLGVRLGTGAHLVDLRRVRSGDATIEQAIPLAEVEHEPARAAAAVVPLSRMLAELIAVRLTPEGVRRALNGRDLGPGDVIAGASWPDAAWLRLLDPEGDLIAVATPAATSGFLHPAVVLV
jgi:tRNA pseudouridine55 synthase